MGDSVEYGSITECHDWLESETQTTAIIGEKFARTTTRSDPRSVFGGFFSKVAMPESGGTGFQHYIVDG